MRVNWPPMLRPHDVMWRLETQSRSGGVSLTGSEQIVSSGAGRWRCRIDLRTYGTSHDGREEAVLALRAFVAQMEGRVGEILLPAFDGYRPRDAAGNMLSDVEQVPLGHLFLFDHLGFGQQELTHATLAAPAALRATEIAVTVLDGQGPRPGHYFSLGERLYIAQLVWRAAPDSETHIRFSPPLRTAATTGERVILDKPRCLMRLASDDTGELVLQMRKWGETTIEFVEAW